MKSDFIEIRYAEALVCSRGHIWNIIHQVRVEEIFRCICKSHYLRCPCLREEWRRCGDYTTVPLNEREGRAFWGDINERRRRKSTPMISCWGATWVETSLWGVPYGHQTRSFMLGEGWCQPDVMIITRGKVTHPRVIASTSLIIQLVVEAGPP